jgi:hypothetical protein
MDPPATSAGKFSVIVVVFADSFNVDSAVAGPLCERSGLVAVDVLPWTASALSRVAFRAMSPSWQPTHRQR